jgi:Cu-Zn family superoxide dismutase
MALMSGCDMFNKDKDHHDHAGTPTGKVAVAHVKPSAAAAAQPTMNNVTGMITFTEMAGNKVLVVGEISGLTPNTEHGFHIHETGDLSAPDLSSAGPHFNPGAEKHGGVHSSVRHVGDLGNIKSDSNGVAKVNVTADNATLQGTNAIVGRSIVVHAQADDLKTDPSGDSGARVAAGVIEMKKN